MALRLTPEEKALVENAAALGGEDASSFVRRAAIIEARRVAVYRGVWDEATVKALWTPTFQGDPCEGYVARLADGFPFRDYRRAVGKFVRAKFQQPQTHRWRYDAPVFNKPRE